MLDADAVDREENRLRDIVGALPAEERKRYYERLQGLIRDPDTYATLNWFLIAGLHHFYLGKMLRGSVNLGLFLIGILFLPLGLVIIAAILVIELWALFRSQIIVRDHNNKVSADLLRELRHL